MTRTLLIAALYALILAAIIYAVADANPITDQSHSDVNCDGLVTITDAVYLLNYIFADGPAPNNCGMVEPMQIDTNWIEGYIGNDTLRKVDGLRRVYTIGEHDEPRYYLLIPEGVIK